MKKIIKLLLPPIIFKILSCLKKKDPYVGISYYGIYENFEDVLKEFNNSTNYNNSESKKELFEISQNKLRKLQNGDPPTIGWENIRFNFFTSFLSTFDLNNTISILDIGGGLADSFFEMKFSCPNLASKYYIYDLPEINKTGEKISSSFSNELFFIESFLSLNPDIVLFGSSLQYFSDYTKILQDVFNTKPRYILLTDHPMSEKINTFVCAQVNMKDRVIPRYVFNLEEINDLFLRNSYQLKHKSNNYYPFHNFNNYEGEYKNCQHYNLVFERQ